MSSVLVPLCPYFTHCKGKPTVIAFVDETSIKVCYKIRIPEQKVFDGVIQLRKSTMGWFYGFKFHLIINHKGEVVATKLIASIMDDRKLLLEMAKDLYGKLYGDKGYVSSRLSDKLFE